MCVFIFLLPAHFDSWITLAKEIRQLYTLDPIQDTTFAPPSLDTAPAVVVPQPMAPAAPVPRDLSTPASDLTGPIRPARKSRTTSVNKRVTANAATPKNASTLQVEGSQVQSPEVDVSQDIPKVAPPRVPTLPSDMPQVNATLAEPNVPIVAITPPDVAPVPAEAPDDSMSDSLSYTSTLPEIFDVGADDSAPPATGPWMIIDHFTGEVTVDDGQSPPVPDAQVIPTTAGPSPAGVEVAITPRSGVNYLVETSPELLFEDEDVRPQWLMTAVKSFFRFVPYFGGLGKVVDLYLAQEARLRYPQLVCTCSFYFIISVLTISVRSSRTSIWKPAHRDCHIYEMGQEVRPR